MSVWKDTRTDSDRMRGCIVTFENGAGGKLTLHRDGSPREALEVLCGKALAVDETYRIVSYSTPGTIMSDLAGRKPSNPKQTRPASVEVQVAAGAGLRHMLHERLLISTEANLSERGRRHRYGGRK